MKNHSHLFGVEKMCKVFKLSKSGYYHWKDRKPSARSVETAEIIREINQIYGESKGRYGSPKITHELKERGRKVSRPRVARIMRSQGLRSIVCKKFKVTTTNSNHRYPVAGNLLNRDFHASRPGMKWVSDITYIPTDQGWLYLTIILDLYDRKIVGWSLSTDMTTENTILAAWRMALIHRPVTEPLLFHSDRGVQYASYAFTDELKSSNVTQSMSRKGNCWDNAVAENFFKILKSELIKHTKFHSLLQARNETFEFIEVWYNRKRKHANLGFKTPVQFGEINYSKCA